MIEEAVVRITVSRVLTDRAIDRIADAVVALQEKEDTTTPILQHQLNECEKGIENLLNAVQMGIFTASTKERLEALEQQREALKLSILQVQMARPKYNKAQVVNWISRFKYGNIRSKAYRKQIIETFVNSVYVYDDHFLFTYNFKDSTETVSLQEIESSVCSDMLNGAPPKKEVTFVYQKLLLFLSKPQAWYIITVQSVVYITSPFGGCISSPKVHPPAA